MIIKPRDKSSNFNKSVRRVKFKDKELYHPPVPDGLIVVVDTREQTPYGFSGIPRLMHKLDAGDYSMYGHENEISIERKSVTDFYNTITRGRDRFERMLSRMQVCKFKGMVIEEKEDDVLCPEMYGSGVHKNSVYASIISFEFKYGIHMYYGNKEECENKILNWLICYFKLKMIEIESQIDSGKGNDKENVRRV